MKEVHELVGEYVLSKRLERKLNCTQFSKKVGVARSTIFNIERKVGTCVSVAGMNSLLMALDLDWKELAEILDENNKKRGMYDRD
jgi:DNA-binding XRE family transcriptional regulator